MRLFLIVYDRRGGQVLRLDEYGEEERTAAARERLVLEKQHRGDPNVEVVIISAPSREALERTHGRYFKSPSELAARVAV